MGLPSRSHLLAAAAAALALALPAAAANKKDLFGRMAQETATGASTGNAAMDAAVGTFATMAENAADGVASSANAGNALGEIVESFEETQWKMAERAFGGDMLGVLKDTMLTNKQHLAELTEAWSNPRIFNYLYDNTPFFSAIKPLRALKEGMEAQTGWTPEQGKQAVKLFADVMMKTLTAVEGVRDPQSLAAKLYDYANGNDAAFNALKDRLEAGDDDAKMEMQQYMLNKELGDVIDLEAMGFGGTEPPIFAQLRDAVKNQEPGIWDSVLESPLSRKYMDDPMVAVREAVAATNEYAQYWKEHKPLNP